MRWIDGWLTLSPATQWITWCVSMALLALLGYRIWLYPLAEARMHSDTHLLSQAEQWRHIQRQWVLARHQYRLARDELALMASPPPVFSAQRFAQKARSELVSWRPGEGRGTLTLALPWPELGPLFIHLASEPVMLKTFSVQSAGETLSATLELELPDAACFDPGVVHPCRYLE